MLHREERGGSGGGQLEEAVGQLTARLEGFIYSFQAGKRRRISASRIHRHRLFQSTCERMLSQILSRFSFVLAYGTVKFCSSRMFLTMQCWGSGSTWIREQGTWPKWTNKPEFQSLFHVKNYTFLTAKSGQDPDPYGPWIRIRTETNADPQHWFFLIKSCGHARSDPHPASPSFIRFQVLLIDTLNFCYCLFLIPLEQKNQWLPPWTN